MYRKLPVYIATIAGMILMIDYFINIPALTKVASEIQAWTVLISAFLLGIGMVNLLLVNIRGLQTRRTDILDNIVLIGALVVMFVVTLFSDQFDTAYRWLFHEIYAPLGTAVFSLLMYAMASAAYRAIRLKSIESTVFLIAAVTAMLGVAPVGETISPQIPKFYTWMLQVLNMAGQRGIIMGGAIGAMAASLRVLLGIERRHIGLE